MKRKRIKTLFTALVGIVVAAVMCFTAVGCKSSVQIWQPSEETDLNAYGATALDGEIHFGYESVSADAYTVYVSPRGNNANDGRSLYSSVYSIKQAQALVREYLSSGGSGDCVIVLDDGEYFIANTLNIGYSDVPTDGKLYIRSKNPNGATISGARRVDNSTVVEIANDEKLGRVWKIPCEKPINQLYVNEDYAIRARYPDAGEQLRLLNWDNSLKQIIIDAEDIKDFTDEELSGSSFVAEIMWAESYIRVDKVVRGEKTANIVPVSQDIGVFARTSPNAKERQSYHLENSRAFLSERG